MKKFKKIDPNSIPKNAYTKNLADSYIWFSELQNASIRYAGTKFPYDVWEKLYSRKTNCELVSFEEELSLNSCKRTAIILLGLSCCGKTSFARDFKKRYPNFELCLFDEIELNIALRYIENGFMLSPQAADAMAISEFGNTLEENSKKGNNIVVDGQFVYSNSRGALIKTLRQLGYQNIIIFNFLNAPREYIKKRLQARALEEALYENFSEKSLLEETRRRMSTIGRDTTEMLTAIMPIEKWKETEDYKKNYSDLYKNYYEREPIESGLMFQKHYQLFGSGVDKMLNIF